jgi:hypothetical protein
MACSGFPIASRIILNNKFGDLGFEATLWATADKLRGNLDAAEYKHELNPNDNQGVRYILIPDYLRLKRLDRLEMLFAKHKEEKHSAVFAWGRVLERFLLGDAPGAIQALVGARRQNPHMQKYLIGKRKKPGPTPAAYAPGSREEAVCFADVMREAWSAHPEALQWLSTQ